MFGLKNPLPVTRSASPANKSNSLPTCGVIPSVSIAGSLTSAFLGSWPAAVAASLAASFACFSFSSYCF